MTTLHFHAQAAENFRATVVVEGNLAATTETLRRDKFPLFVVAGTKDLLAVNAAWVIAAKPYGRTSA